MKLFNLSRFIFYVIPSFHLFLHRYEWIENSTRVRVNHELPIPYQQRAQRKNTEWMNRPRRQTFNHQHKCRKISNTSLCIQRVGGKNIIASFWANFKWEKYEFCIWFWLDFLSKSKIIIKHIFDYVTVWIRNSGTLIPFHEGDMNELEWSLSESWRALKRVSDFILWMNFLPHFFALISWMEVT